MSTEWALFGAVGAVAGIVAAVLVIFRRNQQPGAPDGNARIHRQQAPTEKIPRERMESRRDISLQGAEILRQKGKPGWYVNYSGALETDFEIAVCFHSEMSDVLEYLRRRNCPALLREQLTRYRQDLEERRSQGKPAGNDVRRYILFACACWVLDDDATAQGWVNLACDPYVWEMLSKKDVACVLAYQSLIRHTPHTIPEFKTLRGWERDQLRYAQLAAAITRGEDVEPYIADIQKYFNRRNTKGDQSQNYGLLDGCSRRPAQFNFRVEGILAYARRGYGLGVPRGHEITQEALGANSGGGTKE